MSFLQKLKELIGEDSFKKVKTEIGEKDLIINDGSYIPKSKFDELNDKKKNLETEKESLTKQANEFKQKADDLEKDNKTKTKTVEDQMAEMTKKLADIEAASQKDKAALLNAKKESAIKEALQEAGVKNPKNLRLLVKEFEIDKTEIGDDGKIKGFEDKVKLLQEDYKPLFGETVISGNPPKNVQGNDDKTANTEVSTEDFYAGIFGQK